MTYNPNIPQQGDDPTLSQVQLLNNFGQLNAQWGINHILLTAGANNGQHTKVFFNAPLGADPNLSQPQASLYTKTGTTGNSELFYQNGSTANKVVQLTNLPAITGTPSAQGFGFVTPWGLIVNMGLATGSPIIFQQPFPTGFTAYTVQLTNAVTNLAPSSPGTLTKTQLTYALSTTSVYFLVIGSA